MFWRVNAQRRVVITDHVGDELCRLGRTGISRDEMNTVGCLVKPLSSPIRHLWLTLHLRTECPFDDVPNDGARMAMWRRCLTWPIANLQQYGLQMFTIHFG